MVIKMNWYKLLFAFAVSAFLGGRWLAPSAAPATSLSLTVNRTFDGGDLNPGDGLCDASVNVGEQCSLRAAIEELNQQGVASSPHRIEFNISGVGPFTITPLSSLPPIEVPVEIDGSTQPGASCPTEIAPAELMIVLDGSNVSSGLFLTIGSEGSTIHGLVIVNFGEGVFVASQDNTVSCNQVMNNDHGIFLIGGNNTIGGQLSPYRNVLSNNNFYGILIDGMNNKILNNFIGSTVDGTGAAGNNLAGIYVNGNNNVIGGPTPTARNLISGNGLGIWVNGGENNTILGNFIGVAIDGTSALPNDYSGIRLDGYAFANQIGGTASGEANLISHNGRKGVVLNEGLGFYPIQNEIRGNFIFSNGGLGIDLGGDGVTGNDTGDNDGDANLQQNYPLLNSNQGSAIVSASLDSQPDTTYLVDIYRSHRCDPSGFGEGQQYLDTAQVKTDGTGLTTFELDLTDMVFTGDWITATATDLFGNTSEFSNCVTVTLAENAYAIFLPMLLR
jgi:hypothetical protein